MHMVLLFHCVAVVAAPAGTAGSDETVEHFEDLPRGFLVETTSYFCL